MDEKNEKVYTLKNVRSEIARIEKSKEKKREKIKQLTDEIKADSSRLKELEAVYDNLYHEDLQRQIAAAWFKGKKMTGEQITKFLELSTQIQDKIDLLDVKTVVEAVTTVFNEQQKAEATEASADSGNTEKENNAASSDLSSQTGSVNNSSETGNSYIAAERSSYDRSNPY